MGCDGTEDGGRRNLARRLAALAAGALLSFSAWGADDPGEVDPGAAAPTHFLMDRRLAAGFEKTLVLADRKLREARCAAILTSFADAQGRPLGGVLTSWGIRVEQLIPSLYFASGRNLSYCQRSVSLAFTTPGSRVIYLCDPKLLVAQQQDPERAAHLVIHEALHALGLGEDPPTSDQITQAVAHACGE